MGTSRVMGNSKQRGINLDKKMKEILAIKLLQVIEEDVKEIYKLLDKRISELEYVRSLIREMNIDG